jgi:hypothetical protein
VRTSQFVAKVAAATTALALVAAACGTESPASQSAASEPTSPATTTSGPTTTGAPPTSEPAGSATAGSEPAAAGPDLQAYSQCMRDNGIANFPDPDPSTGGIAIDADAVGMGTPQYEAAEEACKDLQGEGGSTNEQGGP